MENPMNAFIECAPNSSIDTTMSQIFRSIARKYHDECSSIKMKFRTNESRFRRYRHKLWHMKIWWQTFQIKFAVFRIRPLWVSIIQEYWEDQGLESICRDKELPIKCRASFCHQVQSYSRMENRKTVLSTYSISSRQTSPIFKNSFLPNLEADGTGHVILHMMKAVFYP